MRSVPDRADKRAVSVRRDWRQVLGRRIHEPGRGSWSSLRKARVAQWVPKRSRRRRHPETALSLNPPPRKRAGPKPHHLIGLKTWTTRVDLHAPAKASNRITADTESLGGIQADVR